MNCCCKDDGKGSLLARAVEKFIEKLAELIAEKIADAIGKWLIKRFNLEEKKEEEKQ